MTMEVSVDIDQYDHLTLGPVRNHLETPIVNPTQMKLAMTEQVRLDALKDTLALPPTDQREGYYGERHYEYWLSGRHAAESVVKALKRDLPKKPVILEFGGATGRVIRHMPALIGRDARCYIADVREDHVDWVNTHLAPTVTAFRTRFQPPLPFPDHSVDMAFAFSVFTHIYEWEAAWLLEFKRVLKPGSLFYVTIHDNKTWTTLERSPFNPWFTNIPQYQETAKRMPELEGRLQFTYHRAPDGTRVCDVWHSHDYIRKVWSAYYTVEDIIPLDHDHQATVILRA